MSIKILSGPIPLILGDDNVPPDRRPIFTFDVGNLDYDFGILHYMLDGEGGRGYTIDLNNVTGHLYTTPAIRLYGSICTPLGHAPLLARPNENNLQFTPVGGGPPLNILHVALQYVGAL